MRRLKCEKETIILTNEDDGFYDVYTFNQSLQKRLRSFAEIKGFIECDLREKRLMTMRKNESKIR